MDTTRLAIVLSLALTPLSAQRLAAYGPQTGGIVEIQPPMAALQAVPAAIPPILGYATAPALPAFPPFGDSTFDNVLGLHWYTDGNTFAAMPSPTIPAAAAPPPPFPLTPAVLAITLGPIAGIAIDSATGVMFLCNPVGVVVGVLPTPAMPIVVPSFFIAWPTAPITGLDWDGATGSLYAVDVAGTTYNFLPGGALLGAPIPPPFPLPATPGDIAIDRTLRLNSAGLRPLYVAYGSQIVDVNDPTPTVFSAGTISADGLAFLNFPGSEPPNASCICPGTTYPTPLTVNGPMTAGNGAFAVGYGGMPVGFPMLFLFEVTGLTNTTYPWINTVGCGLGLIPGSPGLVLLSGVAGPTGTATVPLNLGGPSLPLGTTLFLQGATFCAADPSFGLVFTPMSSLYVAAP